MFATVELNLSSSTNTLIVLLEALDTVERGEGWTDEGAEEIGGELFHRYSNGATQLLVMQVEVLWQNRLVPEDVSGDGNVFPFDALLLINYINSHPGDSSLPSQPDVPPPYLDVNEDGLVTPGDVLHVVNLINANSEGEFDGRAGFGNGGFLGPAPTDRPNFIVRLFAAGRFA
jgi:hypothetical protein